ncbi:hypothetical protein E4U42_000781 [Claviceps africana]|uniref:Deoxyribonuclease NucA/NucB domain-containing protein n=1 Tax=Claviceps africana TaxID=83212 RepID=A0A8K0NHM8_9HYPO|nr:hypothetical protein E4U42_000781 [Claviceps africana]
MLTAPVLLVAAVYATIVGASPPDIIFPCHHMADICTNMCWAMRCAQPRFPQTLTWDSRVAKRSIMRANLEASGCRILDNRCREHPDRQGYIGGIFYVCDEYPFSFTLESSRADGHGVSRCVRRKTHMLKSKRLRAMYAPWQAEGRETHTVRIGLRNPGHKGVNYCLNQPCVNDGFEIQDGMVRTETEAETRLVHGRPGGDGWTTTTTTTMRRRRRRRRSDEVEGEEEEPAALEAPMFRFFTTPSGAVVASMEPLVAGMNFTRVVDDENDGDGDGDGDEEGRGGQGGGGKRDTVLDQWVVEVHGERVRYVSDVLLDEVSAEVAAASAVD